MDKPICVIPARRGSKRIPGKNMVDLGGKPLFQWILQAVIDSKVFGDIVVSTDDDEIRVLAANAGVWISKRPLELAGDDVRAEEVFKAVIEDYAEQDRPEIVCMAMPTAPFTQPETFVEALKQMARGYEAVSAVVAVKHSRLLQWEQNVSSADGEGFSLFRPLSRSWAELESQSQDVRAIYRPTYGCMFIKTESLLKSIVPTYYGKFGMQGIIEVPSWQSIDIDDEIDLLKARAWLIEHQKA